MSDFDRNWTEVPSQQKETVLVLTKSTQFDSDGGEYVAVGHGNKDLRVYVTQDPVLKDGMWQIATEENFSALANKSYPMLCATRPAGSGLKSDVDVQVAGTMSKMLGAWAARKEVVFLRAPAT